MNRYIQLIKYICALLLLSFIVSSCSNERSGPPKVLVFSKTAGYYHNAIPDGIVAIRQLGDENGIEVDTTTRASMFTEDTLKEYSAVIFLNTTGDVLNKYQEADFERYIQAGGGFVGIHAAADTEYEWGWYGRMVGGYFSDHPGIHDPHPNVQEGLIQVEDSAHASTAFLPNPWQRTDEWYSYKEFNDNVSVLLTLDEDSYDGGADMGYHPIAWYHEYDGGRAFYTGLGHTSESYSEDLYLNHILAGIEYAIGENIRPDYSEVTTQRVPDANRFSKTQLVSGELFEPTEMTILPNLDVLIAQRRGEILLFKSRDSTLSQAAYLDVYWKTEEPNVNAEEGVMGIKADPGFSENHYVYVFYSPADTSVNRLSRFVLEGDSLISETTILQFYSQRDICCHTGGSIAFDKNGLLYLSTGDNATPFDQPDQRYTLDGYAPLDSREGFEQYDALRSSGNANDLRGKIIRIRVNEDGSYDIPDGNLYPEDKQDTRPEIYVQGNRNPYRISIDQKNGYLYWGEVGPDAGNDSLDTRGPKGYDEINQARESGFFGWPMFIADNKAYKRFDYGTGETGETFNIDNPRNLSPNNTGIEELPSPQPAFIWYPYGESEEFPQLGTGGRNAMAGPVYYTEFYPEDTRLPGYFDGKLFIYDWVRRWIKVVTMQPDGDFDKMDAFMEETAFNAPIDMEVGPDGRIYVLEYGSGWFSQNDDSGLARIDFNAGNRAPVIENISVDKTSGTLPLEIEATVDAYDPEQDQLSYTWNLGDGTTINTDEPRIEHTFGEIGEFSIIVEVNDGQGQSETSQPLSVYAGNSEPEVHIEIEGNNSFYFPGQPVSYSVRIEDEGENLSEIDPANLFVSAIYVEEEEVSEATEGHQEVSDMLTGRGLIDSYNCQACHGVETESIGPSYKAVSERYQDSTDIDSYLIEQIINGSSGVWGDRAMPAHTNLNEADAQRIVSWIMALNSEDETSASLPASGEIQPTLNKELMPDGMLVISASYTDEGSADTKPLTGTTTLSLRNNSMDFSSASNLSGYSTMADEGNNLLQAPLDEGSFRLGNLDLTGIAAVQIMTVNQQRVDEEYQFELRSGSPDGVKLGETVRNNPGQQSGQDAFVSPRVVSLNENASDGFNELYIISRPLGDEAANRIILSGITFQKE